MQSAEIRRRLAHAAEDLRDRGGAGGAAGDRNGRIDAAPLEALQHQRHERDVELLQHGGGLSPILSRRTVSQALPQHAGRQQTNTNRNHDEGSKQARKLVDSAIHRLDLHTITPHR